jgi:glycine/D-amino acid oxidase-like deaminating enzyme
MLTTYVIATRPLTPRERRRVGLNAVMAWDTDRPYTYARWTPDHRLILGGADRSLPPERERPEALRAGTSAVHDHFRALYPALDDVPLEYGWEGLFATTPDSLPYIGPHRRYARHLFALGYGGNGIRWFLAARLLLECTRRPVPTTTVRVLAIERTLSRLTAEIRELAEDFLSVLAPPR